MSKHISAKPGEIADRILLPGDPLRAKYIAENFLQDAVLVNEVRNALCYTGTYKGKRVSVMGSGMGIPSIMIYATELCKEYNVQKLIRIGTGSSFCKDLKQLDIAISQATSHTSGINQYTFKGTYAPTADFDLVHTAYHKAKELNLNVKVGNTICYDQLYREDDDFEIKKWAEYGVIGGEMEAAGLYTVASHYGKQALCMFTIVVELLKNSDVTSGSVSNEQREKGLNDMITLALETIIED